MIDLMKTYARRRVFVTGHRGFVGTWLVQRLEELGAVVYGYGHPDDEICNYSALRNALVVFAPEFVFHLAAQAFVPVGFERPQLTFKVNAQGTVNVLEAIRSLPGAGLRPCNVVVVTTDKVYGDTVGEPAEEDAPLRGRCPYSMSKVMAEEAVICYRESFFDGTPIRVATARSGNIIGGGDWGKGRLVPNAIRALRAGRPVPVFHPTAIRPWQYVKDVVDGYLRLGAKLDGPSGANYAYAWNFGPRNHNTVQDVVDEVVKAWGSGSSARVQSELREVNTLRIDSSGAREYLEWTQAYSFSEGIAETVRWYKEHPESMGLEVAR